MTSNTRLRIDFVIREVSTDGTVPDEDLRFIRFGDDVELSDAKDFFSRCGDAVGLMFKSSTSQVLRFIDVGPRKIDTIKVVREVTNLGLKESKDLVEAPPGTSIVVFEKKEDAEFYRKKFHDVGCKVELKPYNPHRDGASIPLVTYKRGP